MGKKLQNIALVGVPCSGKTSLANRICSELDMGHVTVSASVNEFMGNNSFELENVGSKVLQSGLNDPDIAWAVQELIEAGITEPRAFIKGLFQKRTTYPDPLVETAMRFKLQQIIREGKLGNGIVVDNVMTMKHHDLISKVLNLETGKPFTNTIYLDAADKVIYQRAENAIEKNPNDSAIQTRYNKSRMTNGLEFFKKKTLPMIKELERIGKIKTVDGNQSKDKVAKEVLRFMS